METRDLLELIHSMIASSTKNPKYTVLSSAKIAQLIDSNHEDVEKRIQEFVESGKILRSRLEEPPYYDIYLTP